MCTYVKRDEHNRDSFWSFHFHSLNFGIWNDCGMAKKSFVFIFHHDFDLTDDARENCIISTSKIPTLTRTHMRSELYTFRIAGHRKVFDASSLCSDFLKRRRETWLGCPMNALNKWTKLVKFVYTKIKWPFFSGENYIIAIFGYPAMCWCWWDLIDCCLFSYFGNDSTDECWWCHLSCLPKNSARIVIIDLAAGKFVEFKSFSQIQYTKRRAKSSERKSMARRKYDLKCRVQWARATIVQIIFICCARRPSLIYLFSVSFSCLSSAFSSQISNIRLCSAIYSLDNKLQVNRHTPMNRHDCRLCEIRLMCAPDPCLEANVSECIFSKRKLIECINKSE